MLSKIRVGVKVELNKYEAAEKINWSVLHAR